MGSKDGDGWDAMSSPATGETCKLKRSAYWAYEAAGTVCEAAVPDRS